MVIDVEPCTNSLNQSGCDWSVPSGMSGGSFSFSQEIKALTTLWSCCTSQLCVCVCLIFFIFFLQCLTLTILCAFWDVILNDFAPKCQKSGLCVLLILLCTHYINTPRRRPFAWKFSWFMSRFYSISYNQAAHFCMGLVVAVVIPQYSAGAWLQRAFCSHAPSQKHRVTSLASSGKGGPAGFSPLPLLFIFLFFSLIPSCSFNLYFSAHSLQRFTIVLVDRKKKGGGVEGVRVRVRVIAGDSCLYPWCLDWYGFCEWRCIGGNHWASVPGTLVSPWPSCERGSEGHRRGSLWKDINFSGWINRVREL